MATLRSPHGCPWDRKQTHKTLRPFLLEEAYELLDAIDRGDDAELPGELGDVLFQCVFHAQVAAERGRFDIVDALDAISAKLIRRHPHVFTASGRPLGPRRPATRAKTSDAVLTQWEAIKAAEQANQGRKKRILAGVPASMPSLLRAHEIGTRAAAVGFDWDRADDVVDKIDEEVHELRAALRESPGRAEEELGDVLFSLANLARKLGIEPESALRKANDKFTQRFDAVEAALQKRGRTVHEASQSEMEAEWQRVKVARAPKGATRSGVRPLAKRAEARRRAATTPRR